MVQSRWRGSLLEHCTLLQAATWASIIWALVAISCTPVSISMWFPVVQSWSFSQWPLTSVCLSARWNLSVPPKLCPIIDRNLDVHLGFSFSTGETETPGDPLGTKLCPLYREANAVKVSCSSYPYNNVLNFSDSKGASAFLWGSGTFHSGFLSMNWCWFLWGGLKSRTTYVAVWWCHHSKYIL